MKTSKEIRMRLPVGTKVVVRWDDAREPKERKGTIVGYCNKEGCVQVTFEGKTFPQRIGQRFISNTHVTES
jgi:hypothetical protein